LLVKVLRFICSVRPSLHLSRGVYLVRRHAVYPTYSRLELLVYLTSVQILPGVSDQLTDTSKCIWSV